jgi:hypothetical protein
MLADKANPARALFPDIGAAWASQQERVHGLE